MNSSIGAQLGVLWPRLLGLLSLVVVLAAFKAVPELIQLGDAGHIAWLATFQVGGLAVAALLCFLAST